MSEEKKEYLDQKKDSEKEEGGFKEDSSEKREEKKSLSLEDILNKPQKEESSGSLKKEEESTQTPAQEEKEEEEKKPVSALKTEDEGASLQVKLDRVERRQKETEKWGHDLSRQLKDFKGKIKDYVADGVLTQQEADGLLESAEHEEKEAEESLLMKYSKIWDQELDNMRKYTQVPELDEHILAFQYLLKNGLTHEIDEVFKTLKGVEHDEVALTKKMLEFGKQVHDDFFGEMIQQGGMKGLKGHYQEALDKAKKKIDKLEKEVQKYKDNEGYVSSGKYGLPTGSSPSSGKTSKDMSIGGIFERQRRGAL